MKKLKPSTWFKYSAVVMTVLSISACQPPSSTDTQLPPEESDQASSPLSISADTVSMTSDYILSTKPSRYQPSLGLQGTITPDKQSRFVTTRDVIVQKVLVKKGQWLEKGAPLVILKQQSSANTAAPSKVSDDNSERLSVNQANEAASKQVNDDKEDTASDTDTTNTEGGRNETATNALENNDDIENRSPTKTPAESSDTDAIVDHTEPTAGGEPPIVVYASFSGRIDALYVDALQQVAAGKPLLLLSNDDNLRFIATVPSRAESQLSVGQTVNFLTKELAKTFTGQISKLSKDAQSDDLKVYVSVVKNEASRSNLKPGMPVTGRVDYGQIAVGNIVPKQALHDVDLSSLQSPPYQPLTPLTAHVWIIEQNQRLTRQSVEVIEYDPSTGKYLIAGISNDSLICLADLPIDAVGKKVVVS